MTNRSDPKNPSDPMRSLDGHEPANQWSEIVERSNGPMTLDPIVEPSRRHLLPIILGAAAALLLAIGVAAVAMTGSGDGKGKQQVAAQPEGSTTTMMPGAANGGVLATPAQMLRGRHWIIVGMASQVVTTGAQVDQVLITFEESPEGPTLSFQACNRTSGPVDLLDNRVKMTNGVSTEMACEDQLLMDLDHWLGQFFTTASDVRVDGDNLTLTNDLGYITLHPTDVAVANPIPTDTTTPVLSKPATPETTVPVPGDTPSSPGQVTPADPGQGSTATTERDFTVPLGTVVPECPPSTAPAAPGGDGLWGNRWRVGPVTVNGAARDMVAPVCSDLVLNATKQGFVFVNGCNGAGVKVRLEGGRLVLEEALPSTAMGCMSQELMDQDVWFADFLTSGPTVTLAGDSLTLTAGDRVVTATRIR